MFSTFLDYYSGIQIEKSKNTRKLVWFWISIIVNLGFLGVFKYYNFFADSFQIALQNIGWKVRPTFINILLPVGISFYTFHGLSYVIDIYKGRIKAEKDVVDYSLFVSFFPLLVAGPIERATHLLPQIKSNRVFDSSIAIDGVRQLLYGLFMKVVVADNCAIYADLVFNNYHNYSSITLMLGSVFFAFQIYCDFAGYSNIALGTSKLFGIHLLKNFAFPYFSRDISEFWRRWHISLSSWFRDYLYIPLGGSRVNIIKKGRNVFIIFVVSGFWHGANWTFIFWGCLNAIFVLPQIYGNTNRQNLNIVAENRYLPSFIDFIKILITFALTCFAWIFFRSKSIGNAIGYIQSLFSFNFNPDITYIHYKKLLLIILFIAFEWIGRKKEYAFQIVENVQSKYLTYFLEMLLILLMLLCYESNSSQFIYFQF